MAIHLNRVLSHYDIGEPNSARPTERGFINENWHVETTLGNYFLKHYHPSLRHPDIIRAQHALVVHLRQKGFPAPAIVPTTDGDTLLTLDGELYEIQEYLSGTFYNHDRPEHLQEAALMLGRYHTCVAGCTPQALRDRGDLYSPAILRVNLANLVNAWGLDRDATMVQQLETHADALATRFATHSTLPCLVIHGDYYADNLLFEHGSDGAPHVIGVVDYDKAFWQPRVVDLAEALIYFASPRPGTFQHLIYPGPLEWEPFEHFLRNYVSIVTIDENEVQALPDYIHCIWLQMSLKRLSEKATRPPKALAVLREALMLGEWAEANTEKMIEASK
jgi:homoserine kinase type II